MARIGRCRQDLGLLLARIRLTIYALIRENRRERGFEHSRVTSTALIPVTRRAVRQKCLALLPYGGRSISPSPLEWLAYADT